MPRTEETGERDNLSPVFCSGVELKSGLAQLIDENPNAEFILWNGSRPQIKRKLFEQFIDEKLSAI